MYYCTHSDKNYLAKGLALCQNIIEHDNDAKIFYLANDEETFKSLIFDIPMAWQKKVLTVNIKDLGEDMKTLQSLKESGHKSNYGDSHSQFCWTLTPCLVDFLLRVTKTDILYCDADLYFYENPVKIAETCKNKSVGIHSHGFSSYDPETNDVGEFNVGCVYFKNNEIGRKAAQTWKNWLLNPQNEYASKYGTCGDQKYLDLFIPLFGAENICVFDREADIKHAAPWNVTNYDYSKPIDLLFYHFSHFNTDFNGNWRSSNHGEWMPERDIPHIKTLYEQYNNKVTQANKLINK